MLAARRRELRLHAYEWGEGRPLVCLHGVTGHGARFGPLAGRLEGRRVIALDLRGHGYSGWEPPWTTETHVSDVLETLEDLRLDSFDLLGFSFGGRIAAALVAGNPDAADRLCLLDPALTLSASECLEQAELERIDLSFGTAAEAVDLALTEGRLVSTSRETLEEDAGQHLARREDGRLAYRYCQSAAVAAWSEMARAAPRPTGTPTLVVRGDQSWVELDADRLLPGARLVTVPAGHSLLWDAFEPTASAVEEFLGSA